MTSVTDSRSFDTLTNARQPDAYVVQPGDCLDSIAYAHGFFWPTLWNHPQNAGLRSARENPNVLLAGDRVFVPSKRPKSAVARTGTANRFRLRTVPSRLRVRFTEDGEPRSGDRYLVEINHQRYEGVLDGDGLLDIVIAPDAPFACIWLDDDDEPIEVHLGHLDPISTVTGLQSRLTNLGYPCGPIDGIVGPLTFAAIRAFQKSARLEPTGELDELTRKKLIEAHGS